MRMTAVGFPPLPRPLGRPQTLGPGPGFKHSGVTFFRRGDEGGRRGSFLTEP